MTIGEVITYSANEQNAFTRMQNEEFNYKTISTFWNDLSIAECFGWKNIQDTWKNVTMHWGDNTQMYTEFVICLNHKCWEHYGRIEHPVQFSAEQHETLSRCYSELYYKACDYVAKHWNDEQKRYYYRITD